MSRAAGGAEDRGSAPPRQQPSRRGREQGDGASQRHRGHQGREADDPDDIGDPQQRRHEQQVIEEETGSRLDRLGQRRRGSEAGPQQPGPEAERRDQRERQHRRGHGRARAALRAEHRRQGDLDHHHEPPLVRGVLVRPEEMAGMEPRQVGRVRETGERDAHRDEQRRLPDAARPVLLQGDQEHKGRGDVLDQNAHGQRGGSHHLVLPLQEPDADEDERQDQDVVVRVTHRLHQDQRVPQIEGRGPDRLVRAPRNPLPPPHDAQDQHAVHHVGGQEEELEDHGGPDEAPAAQQRQQRAQARPGGTVERRGGRPAHGLGEPVRPEDRRRRREGVGAMHREDPAVPDVVEQILRKQRRKEQEGHAEQQRRAEHDGLVARAGRTS